MLHSQLFGIILSVSAVWANPAATPDLVDYESIDIFVDTVPLSKTKQIIEVTVSRTDELVNDGEFVAERSSSIIFDFILDESKKSLCMNNAVLDITKTEPQRVETIALIVPASLNELEQFGDDLDQLPTGLVTADVNLQVDPMEDGSLSVTLITDILELEGCELIATKSVESIIIIPASLAVSWNLPSFWGSPLALEDNQQESIANNYFTCTDSQNGFVSLSCKTMDWIVKGFVFCFVIAPLIGFGIGWLGMLAIARAFGLFSRRGQYEELDAEESCDAEKPPAYDMENQADPTDEKTGLMSASD